MMDGASKKTWVQGGVGVLREVRVGAPKVAEAARGDGFADSIVAALERMLRSAPRGRDAPLGMEASVSPVLAAPEREELERASSDALIAAAITAPMDRWQSISEPSPERPRQEGARRAEPLAKDAAPSDEASVDASRLLRAARGGMAVWEGHAWDEPALPEGASPFSEPPAQADLEDRGRTLPTIAAPPMDHDADPVPLVSRRRALQETEALRASPTRPEELAPTRSHAEREEGARGDRQERDEREGPASRVHALPLVAVGGADRAPEPTSSVSIGRTLVLAREPEAANGEPRAAAPLLEASPYHVIRLGDHRARVELVHPELGRVELEVSTTERRVDVEMLARSLGASIALRASEDLLRGDLRQRGATLRNYRVRTTTSGVAARAEEEEWR